MNSKTIESRGARVPLGKLGMIFATKVRLKLSRKELPIFAKENVAFIRQPDLEHNYKKTAALTKVHHEQR